MPRARSRQQLHIGDLVGPTRIVGGPRSGKTQLLTDWAAEWLSGGGDPRRLVLVVRSREGAELVQQRIESRLPSVHPAVRVQTHEGLARSVLALVGSELAADQRLSRIGEWLAMREALLRARPYLPRLGPLAHEPSCVNDALAVVSACKRALVGPGLLAQRLRSAPDSLAEMAVLAASYQRVLEEMGSRDPRDWHNLALEAISQDPPALRGWADLLLVDEAEDLSPAQWFLVRELGRRLTHPGRLVLAGHWTESTPGFRGVSSESSSRPFEEYFPSELAPREWRLPSALHGWAQAAAGCLGLEEEEEPGAAPLMALESVAEAAFRVGPTARVWVAPDETEEALAVAREIARARLQGEIEFSEVAILVRSPGSQLVPIRAALSTLGVPHRLGSTSHWAGHPLVAVAFNWLGVLCRPEDDAVLLTALGSGPGGVTPTAVRALRRLAGRSNLPAARVFWEAARSGGIEIGPGPGRAAEAQDWEQLRLAGHPWLALGAGDPSIAGRELDGLQLQTLLGEVELAAGLAAVAVAEAEAAAALAELAKTGAAVADAQRRLGRPRVSLAEWLESLQQAAIHGAGDLERTFPGDRAEVSLMTLRQAKGRSWARVFVCGCAAGSIPAPADTGGLLDPEEVQELARLVPELEDVVSSGDRQQDAESRLFLVALTRAQSEVTCTWARRYQGRPAERSPLLQRLLESGLREVAAPHAELVVENDLVTELALAQPGAKSETGRGRLDWSATQLRGALAAWDPVAGAGADLAQPLPISATSLAAWLACPRQYLAGMLEPIRPRDVNLTLGIAAHRLLELLYRERSAWEGTPLAFRETASRLVRDRLMPEVRAEQTDPLDVIYAQLWLTQLSDRWERQIVAPGPDRVGQPIAEELDFELLRPGWRLRGKVDALWRHPQGEVELLDYKTSREPATAGTLRDEVLGKSPEGPRQWQLPIYQLAARSGAFAEVLGDELPARVRNWYLGADPGPRGSDPIPAAGFRVVAGDQDLSPAGALSEGMLDRIEKEIDHLAGAILAGRFPAQPRHSRLTCRDRRSGCPVGFWCDGEGSAGRAFPTATPSL